MQLLVSTDNHISGRASLTRRVEAAVKTALGRFGDRITRIDVHFSDQNNAAKSGVDDKRCVIEARLAGVQPVTASDGSEALFQALNGALRKLQSILDHMLGKRDRR